MTVLDLEAAAQGGPGALREQGPQHAVRRLDAEGLAGADDRGRAGGLAGPPLRPERRSPRWTPSRSTTRCWRPTRAARCEQARGWLEAFVRAGRHVRRRAHAQLPAPALPGRAPSGSACATTAAGCWSWPRAWPATPSAATWTGCCAFLGTPDGRGALGAPRPGRARRGALAPRRLPRPPTARASSRSTATRPPASATATAWPSVFAQPARLPRVRRAAAASAYHPSGRRAGATRCWRAPHARAARPTVAIVDWAEVKTRGDQEILREAFVARGVRCVLADPRDAWSCATAGCGRGPSAWTSSTGAAVLSELVEREDEVGPFLRAYREGLAVFVNSFRCRLSEDKAFFALLTDEAFAGLLTPRSARWWRAAVPWTRARGGAAHAARTGARWTWCRTWWSSREELVLKPAHGYGGRVGVRGRRDGAGRVGARPCWPPAASPGSCRSAWPSRRKCFPPCEAGALAFEPLKVNANPFYVGGRGGGRGGPRLARLRHQRQRRRRQRAHVRGGLKPARTRAASRATLFQARPAPAEAMRACTRTIRAMLAALGRSLAALRLRARSGPPARLLSTRPGRRATACPRTRSRPSCRRATATCGWPRRRAWCASTASRFEVFDRNNTPGMTTNHVTSLLEARRRRAVGGHAGRRPAALAGRADRGLHPAPRASPATPSRRWREDREGRIWIGTQDRRRGRAGGRPLPRQRRAPGLPSPQVRALLVVAATARCGRARRRGLARVREGQGGRRSTTRRAWAATSITALAEDERGLVGGHQRRARPGARRATRFRDLTRRDGLSHDSVRALHMDADGQPVDRHRQRRPEPLARRRLRRLHLARRAGQRHGAGALPSREGALWIGTDGGGLNRLREGKAHGVRPAARACRTQDVYTRGRHTRRRPAGRVLPRRRRPLEGDALPAAGAGRRALGAARVRTLLEDRAAGSGSAPSEGSARWQEGALQPARPAASPAAVRALAEDAAGTLWVGTDGAGLFRVEQGRLGAGRARACARRRCATSTTTARAGCGWAPTAGWPAGRTAASARSPPPTACPTTTCAASTSPPTARCGSGTYGGGLSRFRDGRFVDYGVRQGLLSDVIYAIVEDARGRPLDELQPRHLPRGPRRTWSEVAAGARAPRALAGLRRKRRHAHPRVQRRQPRGLAHGRRAHVVRHPGRRGDGGPARTSTQPRGRRRW